MIGCAIRYRVNSEGILIGKLLTLAFIGLLIFTAFGKLRRKLGLSASAPPPPFLTIGRFKMSKTGAMIACFIALYLLIALVSLA